MRKGNLCHGQQIQSIRSLWGDVRRLPHDHNKAKTEGRTYRLQCGRPLISTVGGAPTRGTRARGNVGIIGLFAVGHGDCSRSLKGSGEWLRDLVDPRADWQRVEHERALLR